MLKNIVCRNELWTCEGSDDLVKMGTGLFSFFLHDEYECKFRKMLTLEQFSDKELAGLFSNQYFDEPLKYQSGMLQFLIMQGKLKGPESFLPRMQTNRIGRKADGLVKKDLGSVVYEQSLSCSFGYRNR